MVDYVAFSNLTSDVINITGLACGKKIEIQLNPDKNYCIPVDENGFIYHWVYDARSAFRSKERNLKGGVIVVLDQSATRGELLSKYGKEFIRVCGDGRLTISAINQQYAEYSMLDRWGPIRFVLQWNDGVITRHSILASRRVTHRQAESVFVKCEPCDHSNGLPVTSEIDVTREDTGAGDGSQYVYLRNSMGQNYTYVTFRCEEGRIENPSRQDSNIVLSPGKRTPVALEFRNESSPGIGYMRRFLGISEATYDPDPVSPAGL